MNLEKKVLFHTHKWLLWLHLYDVYHSDYVNPFPTVLTKIASEAVYLCCKQCMNFSTNINMFEWRLFILLFTRGISNSYGIMDGKKAIFWRTHIIAWICTTYIYVYIYVVIFFIHYSSSSLTNKRISRCVYVVFLRKFNFKSVYINFCCRTAYSKFCWTCNLLYVEFQMGCTTSLGLIQYRETEKLVANKCVLFSFLFAL